MSFRTYINNYEWLGNNVFPDVIKKELIRQGCPFDEEGFVLEPWPIKDLGALVKATEQYIIKRHKDNKEYGGIANFTETFERFEDNEYFTGIMQELQEEAIIFASVNLIKYAGKENIEGWAAPNVRIREGKQVLFSYY